MIAILLCDTCSSQQNENYSSSVNKDNLKFKQEWNVWNWIRQFLLVKGEGLV